MVEENVISFEIIKNSEFSWSYIYTINDRKRDIFGSSLNDLRRKVLDMGLPWDDKKYPEGKISKSNYDSMKSSSTTSQTVYYSYGDETYDYEQSQSLRRWNPSSRKRGRQKDIDHRYSRRE